MKVKKSLQEIINVTFQRMVYFYNRGEIMDINAYDYWGDGFYEYEQKAREISRRCFNVSYCYRKMLKQLAKIQKKYCPIVYWMAEEKAWMREMNAWRDNHG